jgi:DNA-binding MarR family transcriptional regulator
MPMAAKTEATADGQSLAVGDPSAGDFGWALGTLMRAYHRKATDVMADVPGGPRGYQVLSAVASGACGNQAAIAEHLGIDRTVMTYLLDDLESAGLVRRSPDPADRRSRRVTLTAKGVKLHAELRDRVRDAEREVLAELSGDDANALRALLGRAASGFDSSGEAANTCDVAETLAL